MNTPTKTLKFDTDVQDILSSMRIEQENGSYTGFLTCGQEGSGTAKQAGTYSKAIRAYNGRVW